MDKICREEPGLWNIVAYEKEWKIYPSYLDFLNKDSEMYELKNLEKEIYFELMRPFLNKLPEGSTVLDGGGGIGRFAFDLVKMGYGVHLVDACKTNLGIAQKYIKKRRIKNLSLHWTRVENLSMFRDNTFDATFAIELICYCTHPEKALKQLVRVTKKNGLIVVSVEGKYGAMLADPHIPVDKISQILNKNLVSIKNYLYVHYYTQESLKRVLENCGIKVLKIFGCHYVPDGIFHRLITTDKLGDKNYKEKILKMEKLCREDPVVKNLARAWLSIGRKK